MGHLFNTQTTHYILVWPMSMPLFTCSPIRNPWACDCSDKNEGVSIYSEHDFPWPLGGFLFEFHIFSPYPMIRSIFSQCKSSESRLEQPLKIQLAKETPQDSRQASRFYRSWCCWMKLLEMSWRVQFQRRWPDIPLAALMSGGLPPRNTHLLVETEPFQNDGKIDEKLMKPFGSTKVG